MFIFWNQQINGWTNKAHIFMMWKPEQCLPMRGTTLKMGRKKATEKQWKSFAEGACIIFSAFVW